MYCVLEQTAIKHEKLALGSVTFHSLNQHT